MSITSGKTSPITFEGTPLNKIGVEEFDELADLWGYSPAVREKMRELLETETVDSPHLARYYGTRPSKVSSLEDYSRELFGVKHTLAVNSGTSALNAAYVGCGIGPGDEVIVPGYTFIATPVAVLTAKAIPVVAEIDDSLTMDPADVEKKITPRTKAIVPVHMLGLSADMDAIMAIARKHGLIVIEDAAQACAGKYKGRFLGTIGDAGIFSISSFKRVGGGEGGMVLTNDGRIFARAKMFHDAAAAWRPDRYRAEEHAGDLFYGQNYRMSELEGAVNLVQMKKSTELVERLSANSRRVLSAARRVRKREAAAQQLGCRRCRPGLLRLRQEYGDWYRRGPAVGRAGRGRTRHYRRSRLAYLLLLAAPHRPADSVRRRLSVHMPILQRELPPDCRCLPDNYGPDGSNAVGRGEPVVDTPRLQSGGGGSQPGLRELM